jgi:hypothetical protein
MSTEDINDVSSKPRNIAFLTTSTTGLESLASAIKDETWHRIASVAIPLIVGAISFSIRRYIRHIECKRGINTYGLIILGLEEELGRPNTTKMRRQQILAEIEKYKQDIIKLRKDNIKIFID